MFSLSSIQIEWWLFSILIFAYIIFVLLSLLGWFKTIKRSQISEAQKLFNFSIILPVRNEQEHIKRIIEELLKQDYPCDSFKIILVDDHSNDQTLHLASQINSKQLKIVKSKGIGKKLAIQTGHNFVKGDYIIQTDADCYIPDTWLNSINKYLNQHQIKILAAPVLIKESKHWLSKLQMLDFMSLMVTTAGFIGIKKPIMLNAANLIYKTELIDNKDYLNHKTASGDDMFLLQHVKNEYGSSDIHYLNSKDATIKTESLTNLKQLFNQRLRWASKSKHYKDIDTLTFGAIVFVFNFSLVFATIGSFFYIQFFYFLCVALGIKLIADFILLNLILKFYNQSKLLIYFPILSLIYPFYVSFVGLLSPFLSFKWKNRTFK